MTIREYIPVIASGELPDPATYCPANGYIINPDLPTPPSFVIPSNETDEKIVIICSSELDSAISFLANVSNSGQFKTQVYNMAGVLKSTVNSINNSQLNLSLNTSDGTLMPEGYYLFKIVVTAALGANVLQSVRFMTRTGFYGNGMPVKELHFYAPNLTTLYNLGSSGLLKLLKYVKFYTNCNFLTSIQAAFQGSTILKEVILPPQMVALTNANAAFAYCSGIRFLTWPVSLPALTTMSTCFQYGGLKRCTPAFNPLPASMPLLQNLDQMFEYNDVIEEIEIPNDLPALTTMVKFFLWGKSIKKVTFSGNVGEQTAGASFDWLGGYNPELQELTFPSTFYCRAGGQATQFKSCTKLWKVTFPVTCNYFITSLSNFSIFGKYDECISLTTFTEIQNGGNTVCAHLFFNSTRKLTTFWQPKLRLYGANFNNTSINIGVLASFECNWAEIQNSNTLGGSISFVFAYNQFSVTEINRIFTALPAVTGLCQIDFRNNPGYAACNKAIAQAKGWTVS